MNCELVYTSAPRGLLPGSKGFTTVAMSEGMPPQLATACEAISSYTHVFGLESGRYDNNPVALCHFRLSLGGRAFHVLSRMGAHVADYSGRTNKIAHHVLLDAADPLSLPEAGPIALLESLRFVTVWSGEPRLLPPLSVPSVATPARTPAAFRARHWLDAGLPTNLAAHLAAAWTVAPNRPTFLVVAAGSTVQPRLNGLIADALLLLPPDRRWNVTFSTYVCGDPPGGDCLCRGVLVDSPAAAVARRIPDALVIDADTGRVTGGNYATASAVTLQSAADGKNLPPWAVPTGAPVSPARHTAAAAVTPSKSPMQGLHPRLKLSGVIGADGSGIPSGADHHPTARSHREPSALPFYIAAVASAAIIAGVFAAFYLGKTRPVESAHPVNSGEAPQIRDIALRDLTNSPDIPATATTSIASVVTNETLPTPTTNNTATPKAPPRQTSEHNVMPTRNKPFRIVTKADDPFLATLTTNAFRSVVLADGETIAPIWKSKPRGFSELAVDYAVHPVNKNPIVSRTKEAQGNPAQWTVPSAILIEAESNRVAVVTQAIPFRLKGTWNPKAKQIVITGTADGLAGLVDYVFARLTAPVTLPSNDRMSKHNFTPQQSKDGWVLLLAETKPDPAVDKKEELERNTLADLRARIDGCRKDMNNTNSVIQCLRAFVTVENNLSEKSGTHSETVRKVKERLDKYMEEANTPKGPPPTKPKGGRAAKKPLEIDPKRTLENMGKRLCEDFEKTIGQAMRNTVEEQISKLPTQQLLASAPTAIAGTISLPFDGTALVTIQVIGN